MALNNLLVMQAAIKNVEEAHPESFSSETRFERAIFFSWGCSIGDCTFCYMSTQPESKKLRETRRSFPSIFAECILAKCLGWEIGFFTGGIGVFVPDEIEFMLKVINEIIGDKVWLSVGPVSRKILEKYKPYIKGVVGSIETINPVLHRKVCPSKPIPPYERMFEAARELGIERAITFIVGLGEEKSDIELLKEFIIRHEIGKIHIYGLIPQKNTPYENAEIPSGEEQAWWISQIRAAFPSIDIQCGIWADRPERVSSLLMAGANSISKFPALRRFGTPAAREIELQAEKAGRKFVGSLTRLPDIDWDAEVDRLGIEEFREETRKCLHQYLRAMKTNVLKKE